MNSLFIFLFLILFPFGQIIRIGIFQPIDFVVGAAAVYSLLRKYKIPDGFKSLRPFIFIAGFSWFTSLFIFHQIEVFYGLLYLFRLFAYFYFGIYVWNFCKHKVSNSNLLLNSLLSLSLISSLLGWLQFFTFPDLKPFFVWGWDIHLFRLVGTFLDPTFLGLIIVFGLIIAIHQYIVIKENKYLAITLFLLISLVFTYSRASYLSFGMAILSLIYFQRKFKKLIFLVIGLAVVAFLLPTTKNHSIELFRSFSAIARIDNYQTTLKIFSKSPIFGIGYDNMCIAYQKYIGSQDFSSHACSGSDSSILFVLATTGIVGLMVILYSIWRLAYNLNRNSHFIILNSSFLALIVHSLFSNSMFYPWIMGWMVILLAVSLTKTSR